MAKGQLTAVARHVRRLIGLPEVEATDRQLLQAFAQRHDEAAFARVVGRHGPLVLGICRRILRNQHDAEDAFQATFLVLARKASSIRWQESVAGWLYETAWRIAVRAVTQRQHVQDEGDVEMVTLADPLRLAAEREVQTVLDEELRRLPQKYRLPVVLCYLEGASRSAAAAQLGWREGTVAGRLARARELLQRRLARRGLALPASALTALLSDQLATATVPVPLSVATVHAATLWALQSSGIAGLISAQAIALAEGTLRSLARAKWATAAAFLLTFALVAAGVAFLAHEPAKAEGDGPTADRPAATAEAKKESVEEKPIDRQRVEAAIAAGLKWLARHQAADGHWSLDEFHKDGNCNCSEPANHKDDIGGTSLALLALLRAGHSHKAVNERSVYAKTVERGLRYLVTRQGADGGFEGGPAAEALATLALCHCYGRTADPVLKGPAQRAMNRLVAAAYFSRLADAALVKRDGLADPPLQRRSSGAIWSILALREGQAAGLDVPNVTQEQMSKRHVLSRETTVKDLLGYFYASKEYRFIGTLGTVNRLLDTQDQGRAAERADQKGSWGDADAKGAGGGRLTATTLALLTLAGGHSSKLLDSRALVAGKELPAAELDAAWDDLASVDFLRNRLGLLTFLAAPKQATPFLNERLQPAAAPAPGEQERVARWLADLDAKEFAVREKATQELAKGGDAAERAVQKALEGKPSLEVRQRLEQIQDRLIDVRQRRWRELIALEVLLRLGTAEARQVLAKLSKGYADAPFTQQAKAALESLAETARQPAGADKPAPPADAAKPDKTPEAPEAPEARRAPDDVRVWVAFSKQQRFGVVCPRLRDPRNPAKPKLLTYDERGLTNSTCLRLDGKLAVLGGDGGSFLQEDGKLLKEVPIPGRAKDRSWRSVWRSDTTKVRVTQSVEVVLGEQTKLYDTVLVKYQLENRDDKPHTAGLRFLLNTCIGANTGTPFRVPETPTTVARVVNTMEVIPQADMPAYVQALETGDLSDPNATVAIVGLAVKGFELPEKVVICRWPDSAESGWGGSEAKGDWKYESIDKNPHYKDACLVLYWAELKMQPGDKREMAFTYGLGRVSQDAGK
jgi:RNA polymerase sigma factor (sigma-70 family)